MVLLTCIRDRASFGFFKSKSDKKEMEKEKMKAEKYHEDVAKKVEKLGVSTISKIVKSDLESKTIVDYAKKEDVDLIIMSKSKLRTYAERVYYNSTVEAVFKKTSIPFLYVP
jgi:nucleotide-binding universal stress UspA family protein